MKIIKLAFFAHTATLLYKLCQQRSVYFTYTSKLCKINTLFLSVGLSNDTWSETVITFDWILATRSNHAVKIQWDEKAIFGKNCLFFAFSPSVINWTIKFEFVVF